LSLQRIPAKKMSDDPRNMFGKIFVVGLAGPSGAGKSTVARRVAARLDAHVMSMEVYSAETNHLPFEERAKQNYDAPHAIDIELLETQIRSYAAGNAIEAPIYDFGQHLRVNDRQHILPKPLLIVEGILALHFAQLRQQFSLSIYLEAPEDICFHRRKVRDITERQRSVEFIQWQYQNTVLPAKQQYVLPSRVYADLVVNSAVELGTVESQVYGAITGKRAHAAGR
jgi:uridine kinase